MFTSSLYYPNLYSLYTTLNLSLYYSHLYILSSYFTYSLQSLICIHTTLIFILL